MDEGKRWEFQKKSQVRLEAAKRKHTPKRVAKASTTSRAIYLALGAKRLIL